MTGAARAIPVPSRKTKIPPRARHRWRSACAGRVRPGYESALPYAGHFGLGFRSGKEVDMRNVTSGGFEATAVATPERVAVADPDSSLTYGELRREAQAAGGRVVCGAASGPAVPWRSSLEKSCGALRSLRWCRLMRAWVSLRRRLSVSRRVMSTPSSKAGAVLAGHRRCERGAGAGVFGAIGRQDCAHRGHRAAPWTRRFICSAPAR